MTNSNMINSKYISQLQSNTIQVEAIASELDEIKKELEVIKAICEKRDNQQSVLSAFKETLSQHEAKLNQLSVSQKELANKFTALKNAKTAK